MHCEAFDVVEKYGKDTFLTIWYLGTARLPKLFGLKGQFDAQTRRLKFLPGALSDKIMQTIGRVFPGHLPRRLKEYRGKYEHLLLLRMSGGGIGEAQSFLKSALPTAQGDFFECAGDEGEKAFLHRFVAAGPRCVTARSTVMRWRTSSRWTWRCDETTAIGLRLCRTTWRERFSTRYIMGISSVTSFTTTTSSAKGIRFRNSSTDVGVAECSRRGISSRAQHRNK
jgi:hypothetical protein